MSLKKLFRKKPAARDKVLEATHTLEGQLYELRHNVRLMNEKLDRAAMLAAREPIRHLAQHEGPIPLRQAEFQVFSQFGDDGIIQYVLHRLDVPAAERRFVEFGVETYREANTRFLLLNDNWSGLILDGSEANMAAVRAEDIYWKHDLAAVPSFITPENIDGLLRNSGFTGRLGLLSIDIDGNDYWVWEKITAVDPALVIVEYNGLFGAKEAVVVPYQPDFVRGQAHHSHLYSGASLGALCFLAEQKGYRWIGCNSAGNNAYFVRAADAARFVPVELPRDFVAAKFREGRDEAGHPNFTGQVAGREIVKHLPVHDVRTGKMRTIADLEF